jgi:RimJ/RimL family protein N-acetyltransferase
MHIFLETGRLTLRRFSEDDVDDLFDLNRDPEVMRYITGGRSTPREQIRDEIIPFHLDFYGRCDQFGTWAAEARSTRGFLRLVPLPAWARAERRPRIPAAPGRVEPGLCHRGVTSPDP